MADGKWIDDLSATTPLIEAAQRVIEVRFVVVGETLPLVQHSADDDPEYVHQLRVGTRRADAALRIFHSLLPGKVFKSARGRLRLLRRAAGAARDWDVFLDELSERRKQAAEKEIAGIEYLAGYGLGQRDAAQPELVARVEAASGPFAEKARELVDAVRTPDEAAEAVLSDLACPMLTKLHGELESTVSADLNDYHNLHQVRIAGKRLRYAMEVFSACFAEKFRSVLYPRIEEMQELLGRANDSHVAVLRLGPLRQRLRRRMPEEWKRLQPGIEGLFRYHQRRLPQERRKFLTWWSRWAKTGSPELLAMLAESEM